MGLLSMILLCAVLLIIAGAYLQDEGLTGLGTIFLTLIFWLVVLVLAVVLIVVIAFVIIVYITDN